MADKKDCKKTVVLILKSKNKDDRYEKLLNDNGYEPVFVPVLSFKFINQEQLTERLENSKNHRGIIFTSQRAVEAVQLCIQDSGFKEEWSSSLHEKWSELPVFVTGKATGKQVREKLQFSSIFGEDSGSAEALAKTILNTIPADSNKELLFPCANISKETLPSILKENGYNVNCITAYCTQPDPKLVETLQEHFAENKIGKSSRTFGTPSDRIGNTSGLCGLSSETSGDCFTSKEITSELLEEPSEPNVHTSKLLEESSGFLVQLSCIVFFSPSGVNFAHDALQQTIKSFESVKLVPIGQSTAHELEKHGLPVAGVPDKPDPHSLLKVMDSIFG